MKCVKESGCKRKKKTWGPPVWGVRRRTRRAQCKLIPMAFLSVDWPYKLLPGSNGLITACYQRQRGNRTLYLVTRYCTDTGAGQHTWEWTLTRTYTHCLPFYWMWTVRLGELPKGKSRYSLIIVTQYIYKNTVTLLIRVLNTWVL